MERAINRENEVRKPRSFIYEEKKLHGCAKPIKYVMKADCWICKSHHLVEKGPDSYVILHRNSRPIGLHRHIWQLVNGRYLRPGEIVKHSCGNPACMNPDHLILERKSRFNGFKKRKLNMDQAAEIRALYAGGESLRAIAVIYGVCANTIRNIVTYRTYLFGPTAADQEAAA